MNLDRTYNPKETEDKIYQLWEKSGFFNPDNLPGARKKPFTIIMPPPNANGSLHMGHALFVALEDLMIRYHRMKGEKTLWLPGADHAGFETQVVFDKKLEKEGRNRFEVSREELYKEIWEFTQKNKKVMEDQLRKLGASCDWSREKFTLDPDILKIVYGTFKKLYDDGLVYRDLRVINWCTKHQTALSDLEIKYVECEDLLYYIKYGPLTLATVRPETKFGDTALAVNPKDKRYQKYIGKEIEAKGLLGKLRFKVIADEAVDPKFGTGVVKITPAHDPADFEIWQRHKNEIPGPKIVIDERGRLTGETDEFRGMKITEARGKVARKMGEIGILEKLEPYKHQVATCYKCGTTLEPLPRSQWFVKMTARPKSGGESLRDLAVRAVNSGEIKFITKKFEKIFLHWMKNLRDWNISRQITWGIRIPAWYCMGCGQVKIQPKIKSNWFLVRHGQTDFNKEERFNYPNTPLNEKGREQAKEAAKQLEGKNVDLIISSDLERVRETAEIIGKHLKVEIIFDENLREADAGSLYGLTKEERYEKYLKTFPGITKDDFHLLRYNFKHADGEDWKDLEDRVWSTFKKHKTAHHHRNIAIITSGGVIRVIRKNLKNYSREEELSIKGAENAEIINLTVSQNKCQKCGSDIIEQDPDVFDTWFSSGQWPFATLMTTGKNDFKEFYPTDVMETGWDILFFWVARMMMLGIYTTGKIPFKTIYLHGLVRDKDRQKMSKSKANVIDPLGVAEIYGADAVRMALITSAAAGNDPITSEDKIRGYRNFATKIWNITRFILMNYDPKLDTVKSKFNNIHKKHLTNLKKIQKKITREMDSYKFHEAALTIYHYIWHAFADKIIEESKPLLKSEKISERATAFRLNFEILVSCLKMLHPFMPFVTEAIYQNLPIKDKEMLMVENW